MKRELPEGYVVRFTHYRYDVNDRHVDRILDQIDAEVPGSPEWEIRVVELRSKLIPEQIIRERGVVRDSHGGMTQVEIFDGRPPDGKLVVEATALCSHSDNYNRKIGREIALGRALKAMEEASRGVV